MQCKRENTPRGIRNFLFFGHNLIFFVQVCGAFQPIAMRFSIRVGAGNRAAGLAVAIVELSVDLRG